MLTALTIRNWKSFAEARLTLHPLTVLVGANASGKTNALEALQLLAWLARGRQLSDVFSAVRDEELQLRGAPPRLTLDPSQPAVFGCEVAAPGPNAPALVLTIELDLADPAGPRIRGERLEAPSLGTDVPLYDAKRVAGDDYALEISYNNFARGGTKPKITGNCLRPVFTQLTSEAAFGPKHTESRKQIPAAARRVAATLAGVLALDPAPRRMRGYAHRLDDDLRSDGANISAVLSSLDARRHARALEFVRALPEQDIKAIDFVATPRDEVMVKLEESFGGTTSWHDASVLSDGTLRVLAIAAALLSVREGSVVVIEEVDNGIHPPRVETLLRLLREEAQQRRLRLLVTTHNAALLDAIDDAELGDVQLCYRDTESGDSRIVELHDLPRFPSLVAQGPLGYLVTQGVVERWVSKQQPQRELFGPAWVESLRSYE